MGPYECREKVEVWKSIKKVYKILSFYLIICILIILLSVFYKPNLHFVMEPTCNHILPCKPAGMNTPLLLSCRLFVIPSTPQSSGNVMTPQLQLGTLVCIKLSKVDHFL